jgi:ComF family protein
MKIISRAFDALMGLVYPEKCAACDALIDAPGLCASCRVSLYPLGAACDVCAEPQEAPTGTTCRRCRSSMPPYRRVRAPWRYGGELAVALRRLKYGGGSEPTGAKTRPGRAELARSLAALLAPSLRDATVAVDLIVPVPLHPARHAARGFSQAHAIVRAASRIVTLDHRTPIAPRALARHTFASAQAGLSRAERIRNVRGAFVVTDARAVDGRTVLLVDDVVTTGATAAACARVLRRAGAVAVDVLALARAEA